MMALVATDEPRGDAEHLYQIGWSREHDGGPPAQAIEAYCGAAAIAASPPLAVDALFRAGFVAQHSALRGLAIAAYRDCVALARERAVRTAVVPHAHYWLGFNLEAEGRYLEAIDCYREVSGECGLLGLEAAFHGLLCFAAVGRFEAALAWSDGYAGLARELSAGGQDVGRLVEAIARERRELALVLHMESKA
jgi:tetratricopeptide (TPR) repeat protein